MWVLNFLPEIVFHVVLITSALCLLCSPLLKFVPVIAPYKSVIQIVALIFFASAVWYEGGIAKDKEYAAKIKEYEHKIAIADALSESYNNQLQATIAENKKKIIDISTANKNKLKELSEKLNKDCRIEAPVINLLNDAARGVAK